jgi:peptidoglycan/xylan/chitin deacetylase (PgdA/CDA1 family)
MKRSLLLVCPLLALIELPSESAAHPPGLDPAAPLLHDALQALTEHRHMDCWNLLELARSNFPYARTQVHDLLEQLDAQCSEEEKIGRVSVHTWPNDKMAALAFTFDDALESAVRRAVPALDADGSLATFYLYKYGVCNPQEWRELAKTGHELGNHTTSHASNLTNACALRIQEEIDDCENFLKAQLGSEGPRTFAYPFTDAGPYGSDLRKTIRSRFLAARVGPRPAICLASPTQMDLVPSFMMESNSTVAQVEAQLQNALAYNGLLVLTFHAVAEPDGWQPVSQEVWDGCVDLVRQHAGDLWIAPAANIASYVSARRQAAVSSQRIGCDRISVTIGCPVDAHKLLQPLSIKVRIPSDWQKVSLGNSVAPLSVHQSEVHLHVPADGTTTVINKAE